ncbi:MAG: DHH family phosphoesterase [Candidatus Kapaibacterium sp.]
MDTLFDQPYDLEAAKENALRILLDAKKLVISTHNNPDGDAIGSALAVYNFAREHGIDATVVNHSETPYNFEFLEGAKDIRKYQPGRDDEIFDQADTIFVVDLNAGKRLKSVEAPIERSNAVKVLIDHHMEPVKFTDHWVIDYDASSAGEIIYKVLARAGKGKISRASAEALYVAIMTDTGSFRFPRTDPEVHRIIADLIECGANPVRMYEEVYNVMPANAAKLLGVALSGMEFYNDGALCVMTINRNQFRETGSKGPDVEGIVENTHAIAGVKLGVLMSEDLDEDEIRMSFRSKDEVPARDLAMQFGGGGHFHAAGARVKHTTMDELKSRLVELSKQYL